MRQLIELDPVRFQPLHAGMVTDLADLLGRQGRLDEATAKAEHAVNVLRGLTGDHEARLARALGVLATQLTRLQRFPDLEPVVAEEIELRRRAGEATSYLADRLRIHAVALRLTGRAEDALRMVDESIALWDRVVAREPGQHDKWPAAARQVRAECLEDLAG